MSNILSLLRSVAMFCPGPKTTLATSFAVAALLLQGMQVQKAYAHSLSITANAACGDSGAVISYTVTSWDQNPADPGGTNAKIQVLFNGVIVDTEAFMSNTTPSDQFSGTKAAPPATTSVNVQAFAAVAWGDGVDGGQYSNLVTLTLPTNCSSGTGRFTGGGKQVTVGGVAVTKGFEVDCDLHKPSNNLEINWNGNQFHMTDFTAAVCSLQGDPTPPPAPVNTIMGTGTGRYDGVDGYTVLFELVDNGEPGSQDEASFVVYQTSNPANVVLNVPLEFITGGNIQAHVDQK